VDSSTELKLKIGIIEKEQQHQQKYLDKIDIAIEKLEEISANTVKIIALHEQKMNLQEKVGDDIQQEIHTMSKELQSEYDELSKKINNLDKRTSTVEKYFWLASVVVFFLYIVVSNFDKIKMIF